MNMYKSMLWYAVQVTWAEVNHNVKHAIGAREYDHCR
jgi:hypothetical protein